MTKYYLTTDTHPKIAGKLLAIITEGHPQAGDKEVKVCSVNTVSTVEEATDWYKQEMVAKPWERTNDNVEVKQELRPRFKEAECLKCGVDAGVVEVAGHTQCANCGHIVQDCCGD